MSTEAEYLRALVEAGLVAAARERVASLTPEQLADPDVASWARVLRLPVARRVPRLTGAHALRALIADLRAVGVPYEPDLTFPAPVRHQTALYVALGTLCQRYQERTPLGRRVHEALRWIEAVGSRSRWAALGWFKPAPRAHVPEDFRPVYAERGCSRDEGRVKAEGRPELLPPSAPTPKGTT